MQHSLQYILANLERKKREMSEIITSLGSAISNTEADRIKLDRSIKNVLSYKPMLARIFKEAIIECKDLSFEEIESCIEGEAQIDIVRLNPGETNTIKIEGGRQEDAVPGEGMVTFDIRTILRIPSIEQPIGIKLLVDIEPQKETNPGYHISERAIFYCSRMISAQLDTEFTNHSADKVKYGNLKKVYSIWICTETTASKASTIERYKLEKTVYPMDRKTPDTRYDLMEAIIINISKNHDTKDSESYIIKLLTDLFDETVDGKQKVIDLKKNYGLPTTIEFEEEVEDMTAYTASVEQKGISKGFSQGFNQGISQGIEQGIKSLVVSLRSVGVSREKAIECVSREYKKSENEAKELVEKYW